MASRWRVSIFLLAGLVTPSREAHAHSPLPWFRLASLGSEMYALHVLSTRFSLNQGDQLHLSEARLRLFEAVCLPSIAAQKSGGFVWLIYTDETLPMSMYTKLRALVRPWPSFHILRISSSADQVGELKRSPREALEAAKLWTPPPPSAKRLALLSTRLDADDGLALGTIAMLQARAEQHLAMRGMQSQAQRCTAVCWPTSLEWQPGATTTGLGQFVRGRPTHSKGKIECLSTGLTTFGWAESQCSAHMGDHREMDGTAYHVIHLSQWMPIRARSVTSNSMAGVRAARPHAAPAAAAKMSKYNISTRQLERCAQLLRERAPLIARDQLKARCRRGFSCSSQAESMLKRLAAGRKKAATRPPDKPPPPPAADKASMPASLAAAIKQEEATRRARREHRLAGARALSGVAAAVSHDGDDGGVASSGVIAPVVI